MIPPLVLSVFLNFAIHWLAPWTSKLVLGLAVPMPTLPVEVNRIRSLTVPAEVVPNTRAPELRAPSVKTLMVANRFSLPLAMLLFAKEITPNP